jgi:hypothetical protein
VEAELGVAKSMLEPGGGGTTAYIDTPEEPRQRAAVDELLDRHDYEILILNCDAPLFVHLLVDREPAVMRWLVYDRHLHIGLRAHAHDAQLRRRVLAAEMHLFTIQEIALGMGGGGRPLGWLRDRIGDWGRRWFATWGLAHDEAAAEHEPVVDTFRRLGVTSPRLHLQPWPMDEAFFAPQPDAADTGKLIAFSGGDTGRDYATLFEAVRDLPLELRLCAGRYPRPVPPNVTILPRLRLHEFRDQMAQAAVVVVPLTGQPPVSGITVIAMAKMMGKPIIASDNPLIRMHIPSHGEGG